MVTPSRPWLCNLRVATPVLMADAPRRTRAQTRGKQEGREGPLLCKVVRLAAQAISSWQLASGEPEGGGGRAGGHLQYESDEEEEDDDEYEEGEEGEEEEDEGTRGHASPFVAADDLSLVNLSDMLDEDSEDGSESDEEANEDSWPDLLRELDLSTCVRRCA